MAKIVKGSQLTENSIFATIVTHIGGIQKNYTEYTRNFSEIGID